MPKIYLVEHVIFHKDHSVEWAYIVGDGPTVLDDLTKMHDEISDKEDLIFNALDVLSIDDIQIRLTADRNSSL